MSLKVSEPKTIDGVTFQTQQFPAMRGFTLLARLVKTIGPTLSAFSGVDVATTDLEKMGPLLAGALAGVDPSEVTLLAAELLSSTTATLTRDGELRRYDLLTREAVDAVFSGRLRVMFEVLAMVVTWNFADFFAGSAPAAPRTPTTSAS